MYCTVYLEVYLDENEWESAALFACYSNQKLAVHL